MSIDLIDRLLYLNSKGENQHFERFNQWLKNTEIIPGNKFIIDNEKYYWKIVSTLEFKDLIDEDDTDWFLIYSQDETFKAMGKVRIISEPDLIGNYRQYSIGILWILKSNIESIEVKEMPVIIWPPHRFDSALSHINFDFKQLIVKLRNPKIKLTEFIRDPRSKESTRRIR
jgi:hypothetical protein